MKGTTFYTLAVSFLVLVIAALAQMPDFSPPQAPPESTADPQAEVPSPTPTPR